MDLEEFAISGFDPKDYVNRLCESRPDGVSLDKYVDQLLYRVLDTWMTLYVYYAGIWWIMR